ncbi:MAG: hypothetical protein H7X94_02200, partial [Vallitaleaceae bacterium]|nr:hypothetical protein [Vallitaleaceae bacterium]
MDEIKKNDLDNVSENREGLNIVEDVIQEDIILQETELSDEVNYESVENQKDVPHTKEKKKGKR